MSIIVATDLSTRSAAALRFAEEMAKQLEQPLAVVHVTPESHPEAADQASDAMRMFLREYMQEPERHATELAIGKVVSALAQSATGHELIVCGATGGSYLDNIFLGSTASRLIRESPSPVCVVPDGHLPTIRTIAVPIGFDDASASGLELAAEITRKTGAKLLLFSAIDSHGDTLEAEAQTRELLSQLAAQAGVEDLDPTFEVWAGEPAEGIRSVVTQRGVDLVVMGTHGRGEQSLYFLGSVAERVVRQPPCAVITTRPNGA